MILNNQKEKSADLSIWALAAQKLMEEQKKSWALLKKNYDELSSVVTRNFDIDGINIIVQNNPARIISTSADVSDSTINQRPCFLCLSNLPSEQNALEYGKHYLILCNPYPIFEEHFTIVHKKHIPQNITANFDDMLDISEKLGFRFSLFYNGPRCGASAPDHLHFQAASKKVIPIENDIPHVKKINENNIIKTDRIEITFIERYLRFGFLLESNSKSELIQAFKLFIRSFKNISRPDEEPMVNIISLFENERWQVFIFPRRLHRPKQYFANGENQIVISPAAVDMGGLVILPRQEDYDKISAGDITDIYSQVTITKEYFEYLKKKFVTAYKS
jgi:diadenosine tetraphosphate (Ap4A) HIT family hydrolase